MLIVVKYNTPNLKHVQYDWARWPWERCKARLDMGNNHDHGRCDLKKGHDGDHCLERGMYVVRFRIDTVIE